MKDLEPLNPDDFPTFEEAIGEEAMKEIEEEYQKTMKWLESYWEEYWKGIEGDDS